MKKTPDKYENFEFPSSLCMTFGSKDIPNKLRNQYTNGEFVTKKEYDKIIRKLKLEKINKINEENS